MGEQITMVVTSCGRYDLLQKTLKSFLALNTYPIHQYIIHEDGGNVDEMHGRIWQDFGALLGDKLILIGNPYKRRGLSLSIDMLMDQVETEFIFHCEDDWLFSGNPYFIEQSLRILQASQDIHQVWIRDKTDHGHPLGDPENIAGVRCQKLLPWGDWTGFSWNPGLRRLSDIKRMFPSGFHPLGDEIVCSRHVRQFNYRAVALVHSAIKHIGYGRHTENFKI